MLEQVLQQIASKPVAKSKQSQRQIQNVASRLWSVGGVETPIHSSGSVSARAATARSDSTQPAQVHIGWMAATRINGGHR